MSALRNWYDKLLPPAQSFGKGVAAGVGIPTSRQELEDLFKLLIPGTSGLADLMAEEEFPSGLKLEPSILPPGTRAKDLVSAMGQQIKESIKTDPAGSAGLALGMAAPWLSGKLRAAKLYGRKALHQAERRMDARVAAERARMAEWAATQGGEGAITRGPLQGIETPRTVELLNQIDELVKNRPVTSKSGLLTPIEREQLTAHRAKLDALWSEVARSRNIQVDFGLAGHAPIESFGDEIVQLRKLPDKSLQAAYKQVKADPNFIGSDYDKAMLYEFTRRKLKPDISSEISLLHEGPAGRIKPPPIWTREERGGEMLTKALSPADRNMGRFENREALQQMAAELGSGVPFRRPGADLREALGVVNVPRAIPPRGGVVAYRGGRFMNTPKGWTYIGPALNEKGMPTLADYDYIFAKHLPNEAETQSLRESFGGLMEPGAAPGEAGLTLNKLNQIHSDILHAMDPINTPVFADWTNLTAMRKAPAYNKAKQAMLLHIYSRIKAGAANPTEVVWWNLNKMGKSE